MEASQSQPTPEELAQAGAVSAAAAEAVIGAENEADARRRAQSAISSTAEKQGLELSEESCSQIVDMLIDRLKSLGAFDPPPAAAAPEPAKAAEAAAVAAELAPPERRSFAERFAGV